MELNKENIKRIIFIIAISLIIFWGLNHYDIIFDGVQYGISILFPFILGLCIAFVVNVILRVIEKIWDYIFKNKKGAKAKSSLKRPICVLISFLLVFSILFVVIFIIAPELNKTIVSTVDMVPQYINEIEKKWIELSEKLSEYSITLPQFDSSSSEIAESIKKFLKESSNYLINKTFEVTFSIFSLIFNIVLSIVFAVYILMGKENLTKQCKKVIYAFLPENKAQSVIDVLQLSNKTFTNFVTGQFTEAIIIGVLCFIGMIILKIPFALIVSVLVGFTALIPVFGAFIGTFVGVFLIIMVQPIKAVWFVIFIVVLQQMEGNLIYPRVVGKSVGLPGIWVLLSVTVGGSAFGIVGMLISVPVCSVLYTLLSRAVNKRLKNKNKVIN